MKVIDRIGWSGVTTRLDRNVHKAAAVVVEYGSDSVLASVQGGQPISAVRTRRTRCLEHCPDSIHSGLTHNAIWDLARSHEGEGLPCPVR
jgi:hypothetical protein